MTPGGTPMSGLSQDANGRLPSWGRRWLDAEVETKWMERHRPAVITAAAVTPLFCCFVLWAFREHVGVTAATAAAAALVLVLIVVAAAATGDRIAGIVAALSAGAGFDVFLTQPYLRLTIHNPDDVLVTVLLVLVGVAVTEIALWGRREQARASRRAGYLEGVLGTSSIIALHNASSEVLIHHVAQQIVQVLDIDDCQFVRGPGPGPQEVSLDHDGQVTRRGHLINVERGGLPTDDLTRLVVRQGDLVHGQFVLTAATRVVHPSVEQLRVAVLLADQVGAALTPGG
jgi:K+-sensing histidine kinase KdpD